MDTTEVTKLAKEIGTSESNVRAAQFAQIAHSKFFPQHWGTLEDGGIVVLFDNHPFTWDVGGNTRVRHVQEALRAVPEGAVIGVGVYPTEGDSAGYTMAVTIESKNVNATAIAELFDSAFRRTLDSETAEQRDCVSVEVAAILRQVLGESENPDHKRIAEEWLKDLEQMMN